METADERIRKHYLRGKAFGLSGSNEIVNDPDLCVKRYSYGGLEVRAPRFIDEHLRMEWTQVHVSVYCTEIKNTDMHLGSSSIRMLSKCDIEDSRPWLHGKPLLDAQIFNTTDRCLLTGDESYATTKHMLGCNFDVEMNSDRLALLNVSMAGTGHINYRGKRIRMINSGMVLFKGDAVVYFRHNKITKFPALSSTTRSYELEASTVDKEQYRNEIKILGKSMAIATSSGYDIGWRINVAEDYSVRVVRDDAEWSNLQ